MSTSSSDDIDGNEIMSNAEKTTGVGNPGRDLDHAGGAAGAPPGRRHDDSTAATDDRIGTSDDPGKADVGDDADGAPDGAADDGDDEGRPTG